MENGGSSRPKPCLRLPQTKTYFTKKKKYYQFITSLLLEEPLCIAWLTSVHDRLAEAGGRAPTARLVLGLAGQGATRPARQSSPVSLPSAATSAEGFSGGKEGWCVEGVYSPACRTRFSRGVRRQGHYQLWHHQLCHLQLGHIPSLCVCHTRNSRVNGCLKVELASTWIKHILVYFCGIKTRNMDHRWLDFYICIVKARDIFVWVF